MTLKFYNPYATLWLALATRHATHVHTFRPLSRPMCISSLPLWLILSRVVLNTAV